MNTPQLLKSTLACAFTLGFASVASVAMAQPMSMSHSLTKAQIEQNKARTGALIKKTGDVPCYGINAAYKNDCLSPGHSCAGQDSKARDPSAFVVAPAGLCTKIAGGSLSKA